MNPVNSYLAFKVIKMLTSKWEETDAFKFGIVDRNGKRKIRLKDMTPKQKAVYGPFDRVIYNLKRLIQKAGLSKTQLGSFAAALWLMKEFKFEKDDELPNLIKEIISECGLDETEKLTESSFEFASEPPLGKIFKVSGAISANGRVVSRKINLILKGVREFEEFNRMKILLGENKNGEPFVFSELNVIDERSEQC